MKQEIDIGKIKSIPGLTNELGKRKILPEPGVSPGKQTKIIRVTGIKPGKGNFPEPKSEPGKHNILPGLGNESGKNINFSLGERINLEKKNILQELLK